MRATEGGKEAIDEARGGAERVQAATDEAGASTNAATEIGDMRVGQRRRTMEETEAWGAEMNRWGALTAESGAWRDGSGHCWRVLVPQTGLERRVHTGVQGAREPRTRGAGVARGSGLNGRG